MNENSAAAVGHQRLERARVFYERQGEGLGVYFQDSLFSDIDSLAVYGGIHSKVGNYHRLLSKRFPFAIYYQMEEGVVRVRRILDCRRDPAKTIRALQ